MCFFPGFWNFFFFPLKKWTVLSVSRCWACIKPTRRMAIFIESFKQKHGPYKRKERWVMGLTEITRVTRMTPLQRKRFKWKWVNDRLAKSPTFELSLIISWTISSSNNWFLMLSWKITLKVSKFHRKLDLKKIPWWSYLISTAWIAKLVQLFIILTFFSYVFMSQECPTANPQMTWRCHQNA